MIKRRIIISAEMAILYLFWVPPPVPNIKYCNVDSERIWVLQLKLPTLKQIPTRIVLAILVCLKVFTCYFPCNICLNEVAFSSTCACSSCCSYLPFSRTSDAVVLRWPAVLHCAKTWYSGIQFAVIYRKYLSMLLHNAVITHASWGPIFLETSKPWQLKAPGPKPTIKQLKEARHGNGSPRKENRWHLKGNGPPPPNRNRRPF